MNSKNLKTNISLVIVAVLITVLVSSFSTKGQLAAPASAAAPVTSITAPTSVQRGSAVLSWSPVAGATGYIVQFFPVISGRLATVPSFTRTSTTATYKIVAGDNIADNAVYGWNVVATSARSKSVPSVTQYFKIIPSVTTQKTSSVVTPPRFYASTPDGVVYQYDTTAKKWNSIAGTAVAPKVPATSTAVKPATTVIGRTITTVTTAISNSVRSIINTISNLLPTRTKTTTPTTSEVLNSSGTPVKPGEPKGTGTPTVQKEKC